MSGHSKWSTIKHKKAKEDAKRGKVFTKLIKEITVAARAGGDPNGNPKLRLLIEKAKEANMPQDNLVRAIKKGTGELEGASYEECMYEGYGPHGVAIIVEALTDSRNRMAAEMRRLFSTHGGNLGETNSVGWMFEHTGVVRGESGTITEDTLFEKLLECEPNDVHVDEGLFAVYADPRSLEKIKQVVTGLGLKIESAQLEWVPKNKLELPDDAAEKVYELLSILDDHDDVRAVYSNLG